MEKIETQIQLLSELDKNELLVLIAIAADNKTVKQILKTTNLQEIEVRNILAKLINQELVGKRWV